VDESPGSVHDFTLCKTTLLLFCLRVIILADSGYQGIVGLEFDSDQKEQGTGFVGGREGLQ
jgi:hypothetical protein